MLIGLVGVALSVAAVLIASGVFGTTATTPAPAPASATEAAVPTVPARPVEEASAATPGGTSSSEPGLLPEEAAPPELVRLEISSQPSKVPVYVGGQQIGVTPFLHEVERGTGELSLEFRKNGYRTETVPVVPDQDGPVHRVLVRERTASSRPKWKGAKTPSRSPGKPVKPPTRPPPDRSGEGKPPVTFIP
jgi:hypothetical protein